MCSAQTENNISCSYSCLRSALADRCLMPVAVALSHSPVLYSVLRWRCNHTKNRRDVSGTSIDDNCFGIVDVCVCESVSAVNGMHAESHTLIASYGGVSDSNDASREKKGSCQFKWVFMFGIFGNFW